MLLQSTRARGNTRKTVWAHSPNLFGHSRFHTFLWGHRCFLSMCRVSRAGCFILNALILGHWFQAPAWTLQEFMDALLLLATRPRAAEPWLKWSR